MTHTSHLVSNANRIRTTIKPYAVGVGAVLALLLAIWIPPFLADSFYYAMPLTRARASGTVAIVLQSLTSELFKSLWTIALLAVFVRRYNLADALRQREPLVRTVSAGASLLIAFTVSFELLDLATDVLTGSLWHESVWKGFLFAINVDQELTRLIAFGVALYTALSRGHSVTAHRDTFLLTYLTVAVLSILGNVSHGVERILYGDALEGVGDVLGILLGDLLTSALGTTVLAGTLAIVFAYGIERYGVDGVGHDRTAVADGGEP